ncbi:MAG TPA: hypothetical protein VNV42_01560 [Solirubrobacteraceae bacterium]|jgi:hypothetical protein|nr:hypothetical protein [Solirubrobacteraceae bacterium]
MSSRTKKKQRRGATPVAQAASLPVEERLSRARATRTGAAPIAHVRARSLLVRRRKQLELLAGGAVVVLVTAPMLFTSSGFAVDFTNHLWLTWAAGHALVQAGHPSYFLNATRVGVFYPWFAFYGGTLYMAVGGISELLGGHPILAYVGVTTLAVAGTYGGMVWLSRELGLRGWLSHAPGLVIVTSAYYITNLYGRGAWTEFMATAVIAPLLASGVHLARVARWRPGPILVFVVSMVLFSGSHNITLLWGTTVALLAALILWVALGRRRRLPVRRLAMVAGLAMLAVLVNAWYLVPDIGYAADVRAHAYALAVAGASFFDTPGVLLDPLRMVPGESTTPALYVQVPVWFLAWALIAGGVLLWVRAARGVLRRAWLGVLILICLLLGMLMFTPLWSVMPFPFDEIQFPYRLGSYISYAIAALVLVGALALQDAAHTDESPRYASARSRARASSLRRSMARLRIGLAGVCAVSVALCVWQQWVPNTLFREWSYDNRSEALVSVNHTPRTWYDPGSYNDNTAPVIHVAAGRTVNLDPSEVHGDRFAAWVRLPPGMAPILTNIAGGSYIVHISGLRRLGRNPYGYTVVRRERPGSGPVHVVVQTSSSAVLKAGWALSVLALVAILAILAWSCVQSLAARRRGPAPL